LSGAVGPTNGKTDESRGKGRGAAMPFINLDDVEAGAADGVQGWRDPLASRGGRIDPSDAALRPAGQSAKESESVYLRWDVESRGGPRPKLGAGGLKTMSSEQFQRPPTGAGPPSPVVPPSPSYQRRTHTGRDTAGPRTASTGEGNPLAPRRRYGSNDDSATVRGHVQSLAERQAKEYARLQEYVKEERARGVSHADKIAAWQVGRGGA